jgi:uncharacterized membrane protein YqjE
MLNIGEIIQTLKSMVETKIELVKLDIQEQISGIVSRFLILFLIGSFGFMVLLFLSLGGAFYLNQIMVSTYKGFLVVGAFYFLGVLLFAFSNVFKGVQLSIQKSIKSFVFSVSKKN